MRQVAALVHCTESTLKLTFADVCQQQNGSDCGLYAIAFAAVLCNGSDPTSFDFDQTFMQQHLSQCLESGHI